MVSLLSARIPRPFFGELLSRLLALSVFWYLGLFLQYPELHHPMVTATRAVPDLHIPNQFFPVCRYEVQQSTPHHWLLDYLCQEVIINALQKPLGLLMLCCVVPLADTELISLPRGPRSANVKLLPLF